MYRTILYLMTGFIVVILPQFLLAAEPAGSQRPDNARSGGLMYGRQFYGEPGIRPQYTGGPTFLGPAADQSPGRARTAAAEGAVKVEVYSVDPTDPQIALKVLQKLLGDKSNVRMDVIPNTKKIIVLAPSAQQDTIRAVLGKLEPGEKDNADGKGIRAKEGGPSLENRDRQSAGMGGRGFGRQGRGRGPMAGQASGGAVGQRGPMRGIAGRESGIGGPDRRSLQATGPNLRGPNAEPRRMGGSPFIGPEGRPRAEQRDFGPPSWARQGYGPPPWAGRGYGAQHRLAAFGPKPEPAGQQIERRERPVGQNRHQQSPSNIGVGKPQAQRQGFNLKALFNRLDTNHDQQLNFREFSQVVTQLLQALLPGDGPQRLQTRGLYGRHGFGPQAGHRQGFGLQAGLGLGPQAGQRRGFGPQAERGFGPGAGPGFGPRGQGDFGPMARADFGAPGRGGTRAGYGAPGRGGFGPPARADQRPEGPQSPPDKEKPRR
jgi:hypothetical protein